MTLLEAVIAVLVMVTGVAALMGMIINVENANRSMALQHNSLDVFARLSAQIRDAECDALPVAGLGPGTSDPAFLPGVWPVAGANGQWIAQPVNNSSITFVGDATNNPALEQYVPPIRVAYRVRTEVNLQAAPAFQVDVQVRQLMRDARDNVNLENGFFVRIYPVQKLCNNRTNATQRGEY